MIPMIVHARYISLLVYQVGEYTRSTSLLEYPAVVYTSSDICLVYLAVVYPTNPIFFCSEPNFSLPCAVIKQYVLNGCAVDNSTFHNLQRTQQVSTQDNVK